MNEQPQFQFPKWMGKFPRQNALWNDQEEAVLKRGFIIGKPIKDIAKKHGRQVAGILQRLREVYNNDLLCDLQRKRLRTFEIVVRGSNGHDATVLLKAEILEFNEFRAAYPDIIIDYIGYNRPAQLKDEFIDNYTLDDRLSRLEKRLHSQSVINDTRHKVLSDGIAALKTRFQDSLYDPGI